MWKCLFAFSLALTFGFSVPTWAASSLCQVSPKTPLARDQRDDLRMKCLKQKSKKLSVTQCLDAANNMEYSITAEDARMLCLYDLRQQPTLKECLKISRSMEYPDSGDEARWECLRKFNRTILQKQCEQVAKSMSYPANEQRALTYCAHELK